ncbi:MAG: L-aspartate oxidase [Candidatus Brocadiaceae bacterium]|nr:L-aspartate oxidase [Candidatus Brocadiaceae bacterium]
MRRPLKLRRYLVHFSSHNIPQIFTDVLVLGSGVAGLTAALALPERTSVLVVTKGELHDGSTNEAQGGVASAMGPGDTPEQHARDTLEAGCGVCNEDTVRLVTEEGPACMEDLARLGVRFDRANDALSFTREGGHGRARILHADGDATGRAIATVLCARARERANTDIFEHTFALDLLTLDGTCHGALIWSESRGLMMVRARQTVLATGGCGRIYRETSNPPVVTGDGLAMAFRAGASLQDMEFMQFHPTTLYVAGASRALISESLRGEGGVLRNRAGERFMDRYHPDAELAPRDVVSRSIIEELRRTGHTCVYLDVRTMSADYLATRFPTITGLCRRFGLEPSADLIPVRPAAHYMVGGVRTDLEGRTDIRNLLACGEVACTGLHGANRLGSNSLLEGLVFGRRCAATAQAAIDRAPEALSVHAIQGLPEEPAYGNLNLADVGNSLRSLVWRSAGVVRTGSELDEALEMITFWCRYLMDKEFDGPEGWELQNMLTVSRLVCMSARQRGESRGVHYRSDFPETSPNWRRHIITANASQEWL